MLTINSTNIVSGLAVDFVLLAVNTMAMFHPKTDLFQLIRIHQIVDGKILNGTLEKIVDDDDETFGDL